MTPFVLPSFTKAISQEHLIRYAAASGDFNPIHYDTETAKRFGLPGVIAHGMLSMGLLDHLFAPLYDQGYRLQEISVRFRQIIRPGETVVFSATADPAGKNTLKVSLCVQSQLANKPAVSGQAIFFRPDRQSR